MKTHINQGRTAGPRCWYSLLTLLVPFLVLYAHLKPRPVLLQASPPSAERVVFLGCGLTDEEVVVLTTAAAAGGRPGVILLDTPKTKNSIKEFLEAYHPARVIPVGTPKESAQEMKVRLGTKVAEPLEWKDGLPLALWQELFPMVDRVIVCNAEPRRLFLQAACLGGVMRAPLVVLKGGKEEEEQVKRQLDSWRPKEIYLIGSAAKPAWKSSTVKYKKLVDEDSVQEEYLRRQLKRGPIETLVAANPADVEEGAMSTLAPWIALSKRGLLVLTNDKGKNVSSVVREIVKKPELLEVETLFLVAGLKGIPLERRPNPAAGKDQEIEMEPLTPTGSEPCSFATGRLFHPDHGIIALMLARQRLLGLSPNPLKALVVSNPGGGLPLLETFSRNTAKELHNAGYRTKAIYDTEVTKEEVRRLLPEQDIFLWEGHYKTLVDRFGLPKWKEPLRPSLVFLQSCLALNPDLAEKLFQRGAISIVGSSTRTYSGSGGAFTLAFFDAMLYEDQNLGGALRHAKNFLAAYAQLKEKRLGEVAKMGGANLRSAWAFSLWGDPTLKLPRPAPSGDALEPVRHEVRGNTIVVTLPDTPYDKVTLDDYQARMLPNSRLAGLLTKDEEANNRRLIPFVFAEVFLPQIPKTMKPVLKSSLADSKWVFNWDGRRRCGYLLITPRKRDQRELHFRVEWQE